MKLANMMRPMMRIRLVLVRPWNWSTGKARTDAGVTIPGGVASPDGVGAGSGDGGPDSRAATGGISTVAVWVAIVPVGRGFLETTDFFFFYVKISLNDDEKKNKTKRDKPPSKKLRGIKSSNGAPDKKKKALTRWRGENKVFSVPSFARSPSPRIFIPPGPPISSDRGGIVPSLSRWGRVTRNNLYSESKG